MNGMRLLSVLDPVDREGLEIVAESANFEELFARIVTQPCAKADLSDSGAALPLPAVIGGLPRAFQQRRLAIALTAAVLLLGAGVLPLALGGQGGLRAPITTSWRPARPLSRGPHAALPLGRSGSWQLVSDIVPTGWQLDTSGPEPGYLTCPSTTACYVTGDGSKSDSGPADLDSLYFSDDDGARWEVLPLPAGFSFTAPLSCSATTRCSGGGTLHGQPVFISTSDGGHEWTVAPVPFSGEFLMLACVSASTCNGIAAPASIVAAQGGSGALSGQPGENFVRTTDGGGTWSSNSLPVPDSITSLSCPDVNTCLAIGYPLGTSDKATLSGLVLATNDGGTTWKHGILPVGFGFEYLSALACGDASDCMATGVIESRNPEQCSRLPLVPAAGGPNSVSCTGGETSIVSGVITTGDGGATWQLRPLPTAVALPAISAVSCPSATRCWLAGEQAVPKQVGVAVNGGSAMLLGTTDGGASWSKVTFVVPKNAPNDPSGDSYMSIGAVSCPSIRLCVALGASDQGSTSTPVYRYLLAARPQDPGTRQSGE